ncbi:transglutaminase [Salipaludibacillus neizhouensis]|uniref:Transglutaminase n=1 Tax=Salipaludibacillus neizhouensis TaxID=885475 RepID=A0A3A9JXY6_9BACI|nr:transglutaminase family protein [Salipaludibacillus neizhouensis]RKL65754.1 transglutaminase [Salipaludibacillus neizhouensis]
MKLIPKSLNLEDYLVETDIINFTHPLIQEIVKELFNNRQTEMERIKTAFLFVRDEISHSWDIQGTRVTCKASDVMKVKEGICYAKSNLLAALLRSKGIPTGFCYQRLMIFDTPDKGYSLHTLNGIFLSQFNQWIRLDARGNKPGVQAEFSTTEEKLAFSVQEEFDEIDYPSIYAEPNYKTIETLKSNSNAIKMYKHHLPDYL